MRNHVEDLEHKNSKKILKLKELKDKKNDAESEAIQLEELLDQVRTGRQPNNGANRQKKPQIPPTKKSILKDISFEQESDEEDPIDGNGMFVPDDDNIGRYD